MFDWVIELFSLITIGPNGWAIEFDVLFVVFLVVVIVALPPRTIGPKDESRWNPLGFTADAGAMEGTIKTKLTIAAGRILTTLFKCQSLTDITKPLHRSVRLGGNTLWFMNSREKKVKRQDFWGTIGARCGGRQMGELSLLFS